tara:strand:- start:219 stop:539 length:321 start_codon:yes stop_codon:yes gene_type:complete
MDLYKELVKAYPKADKDLLKHYAKVKEMDILERIFLPLGKEVADWIGITGSKTGFSMDDIGANIAGMRYTPEEANERGLFTHTEGSDNWTGQGQGLFTAVLNKVFG